MSCSFNLHALCSPTNKYYSYNKSQTLAFKSQSIPFKPLLKPRLLNVQSTKKFTSRIYAAQSGFFKALQTAYKVGKDGIEAGTSLVPESIPRPIARISVAVIGSTVVLFLLKSFLSTAFFVLATMGLIYSAFIALNKDEGPTGGSDTTGTTTSTEDSLEEARRIMEKYK
nr:transmembrane protein [Tanacetum cinerariifolium]